MKAILCGANGAMGKLIDGILGDEVVGRVSIDGENGVPKTFAELGKVEADVIIDFSHHAGTKALLDYACEKNIPVVLATGVMESIEGQNILGSYMGETGGIEDGSGSSAASQIVSALDIQQLFASMKVGEGLVTYVVDIINNIYDIVNRSGVQMLIFLAGLQSISPAIYEACKIDGATSWETFWKITFPMISPMILVNGIYTIIDSFTSQSNTVMAYIQGIYRGQDGQVHSSAMAWIYFIIVLLIIAAVSGIFSAYVFYQKRD